MTNLSARVSTLSSFANSPSISYASSSASAAKPSQRRWPSKLVRHALAVSLLVLAVLGAAMPSWATTYTVTSTADSGTGSLRGALGMAANGDTINFSLTYPATITLTSAPLTIGTNVTISGPGAANLFISGGGAFAVFYATGVTASISGVTIENGFNASDGGGIYSDGGTLTVTNSTFSSNTASLNGGGIYKIGGTLTVSNSTFSGNSASLNGGGGIYDSNLSTLTVSNSTFSGNSATVGGGILGNGGTLTVSDSTFSGNSATIGGGGIANAGTLTLKGTLLAGQKSGNNCFGGSGTSDGYNLSDDSSCTFLTATGDQNDVTNAATYLGPLANNGGPTQTIALLAGTPGSTAIDAIPPNSCTDANGNLVTADQRGVPRPQGKGCDIGAYELQTGYTPNFVANVCPSGQTTPPPCSVTFSLLFTVASGTTLGSTPAQVTTQGASGLDFNLVTGSGTTCTSGLQGPSSCTVQATFTPLAPGVRLGAVSVTDSNGSLVASYLISGVGNAPAVAFTPSPQATLSITVSTPPSTLNSPNSVTVDAAGDIFIADSQNNRIVEVPGGTGTPVVVPATSLSSPSGVAIDGAGDVFIADTQGKQAVEVPASGGSQIVVANGFLTPVAVAVDGAGDVFVVDLGANQVVEITANNGPRTVVSTGSYTLSSPQGIALDAASDIFIADSGNTRVVEIPAGGGSASVVPASGLAFPASVAVDAAGDIFIGDAGSNHRIVEVPAGSGPQITVTNSGFALPAGVAVDGTGNVYIADYEGNQVVEVYRSQAPSLTFASTTVGQTSSDSPQSVTVQNIGNEPLNAVSPGLVVTGPNFVQVAGSGTPADCGTGFSLAPLAPGVSCNLSISFTPQAPGSPLTSTAVVTDNALNTSPSATQSITLQGVATPATYQLTTAANPTNGGTVTPPSGPFAVNSVVNLTATPNPGYAFTNWTGNVTNPTSATTTITMSAAESVTANFVPVQLIASPSSLNFGSRDIGGSHPMLVAIQNVGTGKVTVGAASITSTGGDPNAFSVYEFCNPVTLKAGKKCYIGITFRPHTAGLSTATLNVPFNGPGSPLEVPMMGTGVNKK